MACFRLPRALGGRSAAPAPAVVTHVGLAGLLAVSGGFEELVMLAALAGPGSTSSAAPPRWSCSVGAWRPPVRRCGSPGFGSRPGWELSGWLAPDRAKPLELMGLGGTIAVATAIYAASRR